MEFIPVKPTICDDCPTYNSIDGMTFRFMHLSAGESIKIGDYMTHVIYLCKGKISIDGTFVDNRIIPSPHFFPISSNDICVIEVLEEAEMVVQDVLYPLFVCEKGTFEHTYALELKQIQGKYIFNSLEIREPMLSCVKSIALLIHDGVLCNHMIKLKMQEIFLNYKYYYSVAELAMLFYPAFTKPMEFYIKMQAAAPRAHTVKDLAELSGYSLSSLKVQFKPFFGMTPYTWLLEKKLDMLKLSLADESKPLKLIVDELGFSDQSHLNNFCKRYLGGTALQVRSNAYALEK